MMSSVNSNERLEDLLAKCSYDDVKEIYKRHGVDTRHDRKGIEKLAREILWDGSNTIMTWVIRWGKPVNYDEIVCDVADKVKVQYDKEQIKNESELELLIVTHLVKKHFESMSEEKRSEFEKHLNELGKEYAEFWSAILSGNSAMILIIMQTLGRQALAQILTILIQRIVVTTAAITVATRLAALAVPFLNVAMAVWLVIDIAGPAYRKTVPTVFQIALLRLQNSANEGDKI